MLPKNDNPNELQNSITLDELADRFLEPEEKQALKDVDFDLSIEDVKLVIKDRDFSLNFSVRRFSTTIILALSVVINVIGYYWWLMH